MRTDPQAQSILTTNRKETSTIVRNGTQKIDNEDDFRAYWESTLGFFNHRSGVGYDDIEQVESELENVWDDIVAAYESD
jgi:hypothetical protein